MKNRPIIKRTDGTALVSLTRGAFAVIDADDVASVSQRSWQLWAGRNQRYAVSARSNGPKIQLHRLVSGCPPDMVVDHINFDTLDNRKCNLRVCSRAENASRTTRKKSDLPIGVTLRRQKFGRPYVARFRKKWIGAFDTPEEAHAAYVARSAQRGLGIYGKP